MRFRSPNSTTFKTDNVYKVVTMDLYSLLKTKTAQVALGLSLATSGMSGCGSDNPSSLINTKDSDAKTYDSLDNIVDSKIHNSSDSKGYFTETKDDTIPEKIVCWEKTLGGSYDNIAARANSIQQTKDLGYIVAGNKEIEGTTDYDAWILKFDKNGYLNWQKTFGESGYKDILYSIQQTKDEGYIATGYHSVYQTKKDQYEITLNSDSWILKLDLKGTVEWEKTFEKSEKEDILYSIQQTTDDGYITVGFTFVNQYIGLESYIEYSESALILKLDSKGTVEWEKTFEGSGYGSVHSVQQINDGNYIVAGETKSKESTNYNKWIFKLDQNGKLIWEKKIGDDDNKLFSIQQTKDLGYIAAGISETYNGIEAWISKLDNNGNTKWNKKFSGKDNYLANSVQQTKDGGYIVAGYTTSESAGGNDAWIVKLDDEGDVEWENLFGGTEDDLLKSIQQTTDSGYIAVGWTESKNDSINTWILKLDHKGELCK